MLSESADRIGGLMKQLFGIRISSEIIRNIANKKFVLCTVAAGNGGI
jgi:hypothetical protein